MATRINRFNLPSEAQRGLKLQLTVAMATGIDSLTYSPRHGGILRIKNSNHSKTGIARIAQLWNVSISKNQ